VGEYRLFDPFGSPIEAFYRLFDAFGIPIDPFLNTIVLRRQEQNGCYLPSDPCSLTLYCVGNDHPYFF